MLRTLVSALFLTLGGLGNFGPAFAQDKPLEIDITGGRIEPIPFAISLANESLETSPQSAAQILAISVADLEGSVLFRRIDLGDNVAVAIDPGVRPDFGYWRIFDIQLLIAGVVTRDDDDNLNIAVRLWDIYGEREMLGIKLKAPASLHRRIAHILADRVYERVIGEAGYFNTQILYVSESGPPQNRKKRLAIMDQDGANQEFLTDGTDLVLTPRFSPDGKGAVYLSYAARMPTIRRLDLTSGEDRELGQFSGMTFAPRFSPDGSEVVMSLARDGKTNIHTMDLVSGISSPLTNTRAIDTSPSYSPEGDRIAFNSDRQGKPQIFVMKTDGSENPERISFGSGTYSTPVWSPRGDYIAFTKSQDGKFYIGLMRPDGSGERLIAEGFLVEGPSWAPNGRILAFARTTPSIDGESDTVRIHSIDITGNLERELPTPEDASDPAWGPVRDRRFP